MPDKQKDVDDATTLPPRSPVGADASDLAKFIQQGNATPSPASSGPPDSGLKPQMRFPDANGKYQLKRMIDFGGMGEVWEAWDTENERPVAIKVMRRDRVSDYLRSRFDIEFIIQSRMTGEDGFATLIESAKFDSPEAALHGPYLISEYVAGGQTYRDYVEKRLPGGLRGVIARTLYFARVCEAVGRMHDAKITHRDLKPGNVLAKRDGVVRVLDFGIALSEGTRARWAVLPSEHGRIMGTVGYMAPEQYTGKLDVYAAKPSIDVFALGVMLFELVTGEKPWDLEREVTAADGTTRKVRDLPPELIGEHIEKTPPRTFRELGLGRMVGLERIVRKCLSPLAEERYQNGGEVAAALEGYARSWWRRATLWSLPVVVVAAWVASTVGVSLVCTGPVAGVFLRAAATVFMPQEAFRDVVVIKADESTPLSAFALGEDPKIDPSGLGFARGQRGRPLWAKVIDRVADSGAKVVAADIAWIDSASVRAEDTRMLADSISNARGNGVAVVGAREDWERVSGMRKLTPEIERALSGAGPYMLHKGEEGASWQVELVAGIYDDKAFPSFAMASAAGWFGPKSTAHYEWDVEANWVRVVFDPDKDGNRPVPVMLPVDRVYDGDTVFVGGSRLGLRAEDKVGTGIVRTLPTDGALAASTLTVEEVMGMSDATRHARLDQKVVILANMHPGQPDSAEWQDGRVIPKTYAHAAAIQQLISQMRPAPAVGLTPWRWQGSVGIEALVTFLGGMLGVVLMLWAADRTWRAIMAMAGVTAVAVVAAGVVFRMGGDFVNPLVPAVAMGVSAWMVWSAPRIVGRVMEWQQRKEMV